MTQASKAVRYVDIKASANGSIRKATITILGEDRSVLFRDQANLQAATEREKLARRIAPRVGMDPKELLRLIEDEWHRQLSEWERMKEAASSGDTAAASEIEVDLLDMTPLTISRPLCLLGGCAYAATWAPVRCVVKKSVDPETGVATNYEPPQVTVEQVLLIIRDDGRLFTSAALRSARPLADLGLSVHLPTVPPPDRIWSGAGVRRFLAGERATPAEVFRRVGGVFSRFLDLSRSLARQETMCELLACSVLSTYLLDAFNVAGYIFSNGERGAGKTALIALHAHMSYLGQLILSGSSYATLRDLADYGATLAFDDAEDVVNPKSSDPDKRTLLLAGSRRGATVSFKELEGDRWVTRHVNTFCTRLFSAIRQPDPVLGSRSVVIPMVRSCDPQRAKANAEDPEHWPCDRRRLIDDLWALGLEHLPRLSAHDRQAARQARLMGRNLDPWRPILAVAHWLQEEHGIEDLFTRLEQLSVDYQGERSSFEDADTTRILFRALLRLTVNFPAGEDVKIFPREVAAEMNAIAREESLGEDDKDFITARRVGRILNQQRFRRPAKRDAKGKPVLTTRLEIEGFCRAYGVDVEEVPEPESDMPPMPEDLGSAP